MNKYTTIGTDCETGQKITIGDIERRSGLYVLGKPGMGKTTLLVNLAIKDITNGHGLFFLDPHGDAIEEILRHLPRGSQNVVSLYPTEKMQTFGVNLTQCKDISNIEERTRSYNRAYGVFEQIWRAEFNERPWLQLITSHTLKVFIENQGYTLAEVPRFLRDETFRNDLVKNVKYNWEARDFWEYEFAQQRARDQEFKTDPTRTRLYILLAHEYVRDIIGQAKTTLDFSAFMRENKIVLLKLPTSLSEDAKRFIGTIILSELLQAILTRPVAKRNQFCVFIDEFQNFVASESVDILITQARKFQIATTIAHQERFGQFSEEKKIQGATAAAANKVFFQLAAKDAQELAPEFAREPTTIETRFEPELVITREPFWDLMRRGHANPRVQELTNSYFLPIMEKLKNRKEEIENEYLARMGYQDEATIYRDEASLYGIEGKREGIYASLARGRDIPVTHESLDRTETVLQRAMQSHSLAQAKVQELQLLLWSIQNCR